MKMMLVGVPGAGKGTQAEVIAEALQIPHISTGNLLRAAVAEETPLGLQVKEVLAQGALVSDQLVLGVLKDRLAEDDAQKGYILDGVPRTLGQAEALVSMGIEIEVCLFFDIQDDIILKRLSGRRTCKECGKAYHIEANPSKVENVCDVCGGALYIRSDDTVETIENRIRVYREETAPLIDFYQAAGVLKSIPAEKSVEETTELVFATLGINR